MLEEDRDSDSNRPWPSRRLRLTISTNWCSTTACISSIYTDPAIFTAEMTHIFGAVWVFLAHESQIPKNDDFLTAKLGLRPIIVLRDSEGKVRALYNRCTHRGTTFCRLDKGSANVFRCPYHGWTFNNDGTLRNVPWPDGYAYDFKDPKFNVAQMPRVEIYRGFIFGTLNMDAPPLDEYLDGHQGPARRMARPPSRRQDRDLRGQPPDVSRQLEARLRQFMRRLSRRVLAPLAARHGEPSGRRRPTRACRLQRPARPAADVHEVFRPRPSLQGQASEHGDQARRDVGGGKPASRHGALRAELRRRLGARAPEALDLASSEPVNINIFPNLSILGNHLQVFEPLNVTDTNAVWYGTAVVDDEGVWGDALHLINALRMRTQEGFPNFGEVDDLANFEEIQRGLAAFEDEWVYMHRGMDIPGRTVDLGERRHQGAGDRRDVHARIHPGMETADADRAERPDQAGAVT